MSDQACSPTIRCTVCLPEFDSGRQPQRPFLVKLGRYWHCPVCAANYGTCPDPRLRGRRTMPLGLSDKQRRLVHRITLSASRAIHLSIPPGFMPEDRGCKWYIREPYYEADGRTANGLEKRGLIVPIGDGDFALVAGVEEAR